MTLLVVSGLTVMTWATRRKAYSGSSGRLTANTLGVAPFYFSDPASTNFPWRFYRGRLR